MGDTVDVDALVARLRREVDVGNAIYIYDHDEGVALLDALAASEAARQKEVDLRFELIRGLRRAVGLFDGAMPITPKQAWEEALQLAQAMSEGKCGECERRALDSGHQEGGE